MSKSDLEFQRTFPKATPEAKALVFFARAINLVKGDRLVLTVSGPDGFTQKPAVVEMDRSRALWMSFAGKKLRAKRWPPGRYVGIAQVIRREKVIDEQRSRMTME
ncbi:MAG: hypothetical protein AAFO75_06865 [Pseudomonadota bacterium]